MWLMLAERMQRGKRWVVQNFTALEPPPEHKDFSHNWSLARGSGTLAPLSKKGDCAQALIYPLGVIGEGYLGNTVVTS